MVTDGNIVVFGDGCCDDGRVSDGNGSNTDVSDDDKSNGHDDDIDVMVTIVKVMILDRLKSLCK